MELECYTFVLLRRGARAFAYGEEELERLQAAHLAHLDAMRQSGALLAAGPFAKQPDESLRGFCLYRNGIEETRALVDADPSIQAERLEADRMEWWTRRGSVTFDPTS
jgi:hypothetical protein